MPSRSRRNSTIQSPRATHSPSIASMPSSSSSQPSTPRSPSSPRQRSPSSRQRDKEQERQDRVDNLVFTMNDVANDGQDLAMQLRELIADQPVTSSLAQDLASNLSLFGRTLRELALYLGTPAAPFTFTALQVVEVMLDHAEELFDQVDDMMYRYEKDPDRDYIYCFKDTKVLQLGAKLESSRLTLAVMLQILQLRALMNLSDMEDSGDRSLRHRIKDLRMEAQSLVLDETWSRRKEKLMEDNNLEDISKNDTPIMPRASMTEAAAAVTVLLDQLTEQWRPTNEVGERQRSKSQAARSDGPGMPDDCPPDGSHQKRDQMLETLAKAALAAGVLGAWKSRSKVPLPKAVKQRKDRMKHGAEKIAPKHGKSIMNGIGERIEAIAPLALAAGAYEVFKNRNEDKDMKGKAQRFVNATKGAAFGAAAG